MTLPDPDRPPLTLDALVDYALKAAPPDEPRIDRVLTRSLDDLRATLKLPADRDTPLGTPPMHSLFGLPVFIAPHYPKGVIGLRYSDGTVRHLHATPLQPPTVKDT